MYQQIDTILSMNNYSNPISIAMFPADYEVMDQRAGLVLVPSKFQSVRLLRCHHEAIEKIVPFLPDASAVRSRAGRSAVIRLALHRYCEALTERGLYQSFSDLVMDALIWYAGEVTGQEVVYSQRVD